MKNRINDFVFYHIYPIGFCGAKPHNDFCSPANFSLDKLYEWIEHIKSLGVNALYIGPVFESTSHGYDTVDYYHVDRRLGNNESFKKLIWHLKAEGFSIVLDAVFNHVGRDFWAFKDVIYHGQNSQYKDWFHELRFEGKSPYGDPFVYSGWNGHYSLVKLNLKNYLVKQHIFGAVEMWIDEFGIDGLRLDAADCLDFEFMQELALFCRSKKEDFWLMGEVIHGDYNKWVNRNMLDSVTNYVCYKGLYSSHVDANYFEIAYSLNTQFGQQGMYKNLMLYNFADNHDVNRVASSLTNLKHLYPLYILLFSMPGIPSIYYGSEWGIEGEKTAVSDEPLRPNIDLSQIEKTAPHPQLKGSIKKLSDIRFNSKALKDGNYTPLLVQHRQFAFMRECEEETAIVILNSSDEAVPVSLNIPGISTTRFADLLNGEEFMAGEGHIFIEQIYPNWGRILIHRK